MIEEKDIKLFHEINLQNEVATTGYEFFNINKIKANSSIKPTGNIPRYLENHFIYSNPNQEYYTIPEKNKKMKKNEKYQFKFNNILNIQKNKLMTYFLCNNYEKLFSSFEFYMINLFNGLNLDSILELFQRELISDSIYINAIKCIKIINENKKLYNSKYIYNNNNRLETSEISLKLEEIEHLNAKDDALFLVLKFSELLKNIDPKIFSNEINKLNEIYQKNNSL